LNFSISGSAYRALYVESCELNCATVIDKIVYGFPAVAKTMKAHPRKMVIAPGAAKASYVGTVQSSGFFRALFRELW
jgi:hypothetical protein